MYKPYNLLGDLLTDIEKNIREDTNLNKLAGKFLLSERHLRRLFSFAFKQSLAGYIRSRKLAASLEDLLKKKSNVLDIALDYGFEYEQSYIRAFKNEFHMTPGELRKKGEIVKVIPPLQLFDGKYNSDGVVFGPEFVMVPRFSVIGKHHRFKSRDVGVLTSQMAEHFWEKEQSPIKNAIHPGSSFVGLAHDFNFFEGYMDYLPSVPVKNLDDIPQGYKGDTFESSLCVRYRYVGRHHFDLSWGTLEPLYNAIYKFRTDPLEKYALLKDQVYFEKVDFIHENDCDPYDDTFFQVEWFAPVIEKK